MEIIMNNYGFGEKKKKKKLWRILLIIILVLIASIYAVVIIVNIKSADHDTITQSVSENADLKKQTEELNARIAELENEINSLNEELDARPTGTPAATDIPARSGTGSKSGVR